MTLGNDMRQTTHERDRLALAERLKEERKRTGLSAEEAAEAMDISRTTQFAYENGSTSPDCDYLLRAAEKGVDLAYVLTGIRRGEGARRSEREQDLLNRYQVLPPKLQDIIENVALLAWLSFQDRKDYPLGGAYPVQVPSSAVHTHESTPRTAAKKKPPPR